jgi:hypothetical protein
LSTAKKLRIALQECKEKMVVANGESVPFVGKAQVEIDIGGVKIRQIVFVIPTANYEVLLGAPWKHAVQHQETMRLDGSSIHRIQSPDGQINANFTCSRIELTSTESELKNCKGLEIMPLAPESVAVVYGVYKPVEKKVRPKRVALTDASKLFNWKWENFHTKSKNRRKPIFEKKLDRKGQLVSKKGRFF